MKEEILGKLEALKVEAREKASRLQSVKESQDLRVHFLGKNGLLTSILKNLGGLTSADRPEVGRVANQVKNELEALLDGLQSRLGQKELSMQLEKSKIDISLPGKTGCRGHRHLISQVRSEIEEIFLQMGFSIFEGPEAETDYYNFGALNFPENHPARAMQDTFYIRGQKTEGRKQKTEDRGPLLLRTHTSPAQIRFMEKHKPPLAMIAPGTVYRRDTFDATHSPMFHQIEGLMVGEDISFANLKWVLTTVCKKIFGRDRKLRFRPSFFPFTEPSAEVDIEWGDRYLEILGAGQVDPEVFRLVGLDPNRWTGFAFGMGLERIAMLKYGIQDLRRS